jgi:hypothetical protein
MKKRIARKHIDGKGSFVFLKILKNKDKKKLFPGLISVSVADHVIYQP